MNREREDAPTQGVSEADVDRPPAAVPEVAEKKMVRGGQVEGYPTVAFDDEKRLPYHLDDLGERVYHEAPEGFRFNKNGVLEEKPQRK